MFAVNIVEAKMEVIRMRTTGFAGSESIPFRTPRLGQNAGNQQGQNAGNRQGQTLNTQNQWGQVFGTEGFAQQMRRGAGNRRESVFGTEGFAQQMGQVGGFGGETRQMGQRGGFRGESVRQMGQRGGFGGEGVRQMGNPVLVSPFVPPIRRQQLPQPRQVILSVPVDFSNNSPVARLQRQLWGY